MRSCSIPAEKGREKSWEKKNFRASFPESHVPIFRETACEMEKGKKKKREEGNAKREKKKEEKKGGAIGTASSH